MNVKNAIRNKNVNNAMLLKVRPTLQVYKNTWGTVQNAAGSEFVF